MITHWVGMILYVLEKSANTEVVIRIFEGTFFSGRMGRLPFFEHWLCPLSLLHVELEG